jgi:hypothetical protein
MLLFITLLDRLYAFFADEKDSRRLTAKLTFYIVVVIITACFSESESTVEALECLKSACGITGVNLEQLSA